MCSVLPESIWMACGSTSITACSDSTAPVGLPGRFNTTDVPQTPHKPRLNTAKNIFFLFGFFATVAPRLVEQAQAFHEQTLRVQSGGCLLCLTIKIDLEIAARPPQNFEYRLITFERSVSRMRDLAVFEIHFASVV